MSIILTLTSIIQAFAISLGVGSSTLAIVNFFAAIADGTIDETERRMMGVVYVVLRVVMVAILLTTLLLVMLQHGAAGLVAITVFELAVFIVIAVLFLNAALMTSHLVPSTIGPGIQAGSWYTLGTLNALAGLGLTSFTWWQFLAAYITWLVLAIALVNSVMSWLRYRKQTT